MSIKIMSSVWNSSQQRGAKLLLLLAIADYSDDEGNSWPSITSLMRKCRSGKRAVQAALYGLRDSGELVITLRPGGGYAFHLTCAETCAPPAQKTAQNSAENCAFAAQKTAPIQHEPSVDPLTEPSKDLSPCGDAESCAKQKKPPDPRIKTFIDWFFGQYRKEFGRAYVVAGGKDGAALKRVFVALDSEGVDAPATLAAATAKMFADQFWRPKASISVLVSQINTFRSTEESHGGRTGKSGRRVAEIPYARAGESIVVPIDPGGSGDSEAGGGG